MTDGTLEVAAGIRNGEPCVILFKEDQQGKRLSGEMVFSVQHAHMLSRLIACTADAAAMLPLMPTAAAQRH